METAQPWLLRPQPPTDPWQALIAQKLIEISGTAAHARLTYAVHWVHQAQSQGETVAWIQPRGGALFPPDLHDSGVDLRALVVIHVPPQAGAHGIPKAAEILLQSGAYGLVVLDLLAGVPPSGVAWQGRLLSQARQHGSGVIILTDKPAQWESLGALATSRLEPQRHRQQDTFLVTPTVLKNKASTPWPSMSITYRSPWGAV